MGESEHKSETTTTVTTPSTNTTTTTTAVTQVVECVEYEVEVTEPWQVESLVGDDVGVVGGDAERRLERAHGLRGHLIVVRCRRRHIGDTVMIR